MAADNATNNQTKIDLVKKVYLIHYYLGFGQDHPDNFHKTLQVKVTSPHTVRATFKQFDGHRVGADFTLKCTENRYLIDDFKMIGDQTGIKTDYKLVLLKQKCE